MGQNAIGDIAVPPFMSDNPAMALSAGLHPSVTAALTLAFPLMLAGTIAREILAGKNWRNLKVLGGLAVVGTLDAWRVAGASVALAGLTSCRKPVTKILPFNVQPEGYKHGVPLDADLVFDVRCLPNPHWQTGLREKTGLDTEVRQFLDGDALVESLYRDISGFLLKWLPEFRENDRSYVTVAIGCTGGQHRSVYMVERMATCFRAELPHVQVRHRDLPDTTTSAPIAAGSRTHD